MDISAGAVITVQDNVITNCRGVASSDGSTSAAIMLTTYFGAGTQADITGNTLTGNTAGITVGYDATDTSVVTASCNSIIGNDTGVNNVGLNTVDAKNNWWGDAAGPGTAVSGNVDFFPWLISDECTDVTVQVGDIFVDDDWAGIPDYSIVTVGSNDYYIGIDAFATIVEAVATGISGDTINVIAGTYFEVGQIVIDKDLTIIGADSATVIVKPDHATSGGSYAPENGWVTVMEGANLNLKNVTLDGTDLAGVLQPIRMAIQSRGTSVIEDCVIKNIRLADNLGWGITILAGTENKVLRCQFSNIHRIGVHVRGAVVDVNPVAYIEDCTYVGKGDAGLLDYAVEFGGGGQGTVVGCNFSACKGIAYDGSTSAGILVTDYYGTGSAATILRNTITDCAYGIYAGYGDEDASVVEAIYNDISGNVKYGIYAIDGMTEPVVAKYNFWGDASGPGAGASQAVVTTSPWLIVMPDLIVDLDGLGDFTTIQAAIDAATPGDVICVGKGDYVEALNLNKDVDLIGVASNEVSISSTGSAPVITLAASGAAVEDKLLISQITLLPVSCYGINVATDVANINLDKVKVIGIPQVNDTETETGLKVSTTASLTNVVMTDCAFDSLAYGWYLAKAVSEDASTVAFMEVINTTFNDSANKGIYAEKLSDTTFTNCQVKNNGDNLGFWNAVWNAGVDINLKAGVYKNIKFDRCEFSNNAQGVKNGAALMLKGRGTGTLDSSYASFPATLDNVEIIKCTFDDNECAVSLGELGKDNTTPTNVTIKYCDFAGNFERYPNGDGASKGAVINRLFDDAEDTTLVDATENFWGDATGPLNATLNPAGLGDAVSENVLFDPWRTSAFASAVCPVSDLDGDCKTTLADFAIMANEWLSCGNCQ